MLLLSMTRHPTQDVAPVPFLWIAPPSIYLLSFILCFDGAAATTGRSVVPGRVAAGVPGA